MTTLETLGAILEEQLELAKRKGTVAIIQEIDALI